MILFITQLVLYAVVFLLLSAAVGAVIAFINSKKPRHRTMWITSAIVVSLLLLSIIFELFLVFSYEIRESFNYELIESLSQFIELLASVSFLALLIGGKQVSKIIET